MNTYDTSALPLGSTSPKVLYNNASNMDDAMNLLGPAWVDRFGRRRETWYGLEQLIASALINLGYSYTDPLNYAAGIVITAPNQIFLKDGEYYRPGPTIALPYTTTGNWTVEGPDFVSVGDAVLRTALASSDTTLGASLVFGTARVVDSVAALKALPGTGSKHAFVLGYYGPGTRGGGMVTQHTLEVGEVADDGIVFQGTDGTYWKRPRVGAVTTSDFGAYGDASHDDTTAVIACKDYALRVQCKMIIVGVCRMLHKCVFNFSGISRTTGMSIDGDNGVVQSRLDFSEVPAGEGTPCVFEGDENSAIFYINIGTENGFGITTNYNGSGVRFGRDDCTDAFNEGHINLWINNNSQGLNAESLRINNVLHYRGRLVCNGAGSGRPDAPTYPGYGTALVIRQLQMSNIYIAVGNANKGLYLTGNYNWGNTFPSVDVEEVNYGLIIDNVNSFGNTFIGGQWLALNLFNCTAGHGNVIINGNIQVHAGGTQNVSMTGLELQRPGVYGVTTPAMLTSGTYSPNNTGRKVSVNIKGGTVAVLQVLQTDGATASYPVGTWSGDQIVLHPGESITMSYSAAPSWIWRPVS